MALGNRLRTIMFSHPRRWADMLIAAVVALRAEVAIRRGGIAGAARVGHLAVAMDGNAAPVARPADAGLSARELDQLDTAWRVLRWGPFNGTCLRRAVVGGYFLRRHAPLLRVGVSKKDGQVAAHAWVEVHGVGLDPDGATVYSVLRTPGEVK